MSIDCKGQYSTPKHLNIENVSYCQPFSKQMLFLLKCPPVHEKIFSCKTYGTLISAQPT